MRKEISNDEIPEDEMLLSELISFSKDRGLGWIKGAMFHPIDYSDEGSLITENVKFCCAGGALYLYKGFSNKGFSTEPLSRSYFLKEISLLMTQIYFGNDFDEIWCQATSLDMGESLGWAYRNAMEE